MRHGVWLATLWLTAAGAATIQVTVTDSHDQPLAGVTVRLTGARTATGETDAAGRYTFADLGVGRYEVGAARAGYTAARDRLELRTARQTLGARFRLEAVAELPGALFGTVRTAQAHRPLGGVELVLSDERLPYWFRERARTTTDAAGGFLFRNLPPGRYRVRPQGAGWTTFEQAGIVAGERAGTALLFEVDEDTLPEHQASLRLRVVDAAGRPLAGKPVQLLLDAFSEREGVQWAGDWPGDWWSEAGADGMAHQRQGGRISTDADGLLQAEIGPGIYTVAVWGDGPMPRPEVRTLAPGERAELTFTVTRPLPALPEEPDRPEPERATVRLRVLRPDGRPLAGQVVYVLRHEPTGPNDEVATDVEDLWHETDANGVATLRFRPGGAPTLSIKAADFASATVSGLATTPGAEVNATVRLPGPAGQVTGRVTDEAGAPLAGVRVFAWQSRLFGRADPPSIWEAVGEHPSYGGRDEEHQPVPAGSAPGRPGEIPGFLRWGLVYTLTAADGSFTLGELDDASYHVLAGRPGRAGVDQYGVKPASPPLSFRLGPTGAVAGTVRGADGRPLALTPLSVQLLGEQRWRRADLVTDEAGRYCMDDVPPGAWQARLDVPRRLAPPGVEVTVGSGETATVDWSVPAGSSLRGQVLAPDGRPQAGAWVSVQSGGTPDGRMSACLGQGWTDAQGRFELTGLAPGDAVVVARRDMAPRHTQPVRLPTAEPVSLRLEPGTLLTGTVRDEQGTPLSVARVRWWLPDDQGRDPYDARHADVDEQGRFLLPFVPLRRVQLRADDGEGHRRARRELALTADPVDSLDLTVTTPRYGSLSGRVLDAAGRPVQDVTVWATAEGMEDDGEVPVLIHAGSPGRGAPAPGAPAPGAPGGSRPQLRTTADGRFRFERLPVGPVEVSFQLEYVPLPARQVTIRTGQEATVEVRLPAELRRGRVRGLPPGPKPGHWEVVWARSLTGPTCRLYLPTAAVREADAGELPARPFRLRVPSEWPGGVVLVVGAAGARAHEGIDSGSAAVLADGSYFLKLAPGPWRLQLARMSEERDTAHSWVLGPVAAVDPAGALPELDGSPGPGRATLRVAGLAGDGELLVGLNRLDTGDRQAVAVLTRQLHEAALAGLPAGEYEVTAWPANAAAVRQRVTIPAGRPAEVSLALVPGVSLTGRVEGPHPKGLGVSVESAESFGGAPVADDGTFTVPHLLPGSYTVRLWAPGEAAIPSREGVEVGAAGGSVTLRWPE